MDDEIICRGSYVLGTACFRCGRCYDELKSLCAEKGIDWDFRWKVHLPNLIRELQKGSDAPLPDSVYNILRGVLTDLAETGTRTEDVEVQAAMCRLALFSQADPEDKDNYNEMHTHITLMRAALLKHGRQTNG